MTLIPKIEFSEDLFFSVGLVNVQVSGIASLTRARGTILFSAQLYVKKRVY